ncbi:RDD family protein [Streptomyces sp. NPDC002039]|uniref:RDD family protein n=1 Tax=Streptomyces sp. NPDC002039 TaxID=3154660 RepID=UPI0033166F19
MFVRTLRTCRRRVYARFVDCVLCGVLCLPLGALLGWLSLQFLGMGVSDAATATGTALREGGGSDGALTAAREAMKPASDAVNYFLLIFLLAMVVTLALYDYFFTRGMQRSPGKAFLRLSMDAAGSSVEIGRPRALLRTLLLFGPMVVGVAWLLLRVREALMQDVRIDWDRTQDLPINLLLLFPLISFAVALVPPGRGLHDLLSGTRVD